MANRRGEVETPRSCSMSCSHADTEGSVLPYVCARWVVVQGSPGTSQGNRKTVL